MNRRRVISNEEKRASSQKTSVTLSPRGFSASEGVGVDTSSAQLSQNAQVSSIGVDDISFNPFVNMKDWRSFYMS